MSLTERIKIRVDAYKNYKPKQRLFQDPEWHPYFYNWNHRHAGQREVYLWG